jgi:hypothetical protein
MRHTFAIPSNISIGPPNHNLPKNLSKSRGIPRNFDFAEKNLELCYFFDIKWKFSGRNCGVEVAHHINFSSPYIFCVENNI